MSQSPTYSGVKGSEFGGIRRWGPVPPGGLTQNRGLRQIDFPGLHAGFMGPRADNIEKQKRNKETHE